MFQTFTIQDCRFAHERNEIRRGQKKKVSQALETSYEAFTEDCISFSPNSLRRGCVTAGVCPFPLAI